MTAALFGDVSHERIVKAISDPRFLAIAFIRVGIRDTWDAAVKEVQSLWQRSRLDQMAGETPSISFEALNSLLEILAERANVFDDHGACLRHLSAAFEHMPFVDRRRVAIAALSIEERRRMDHERWMESEKAKAQEQRKAEYAKQAAEALRRSLKPF